MKEMEPDDLKMLWQTVVQREATAQHQSPEALFAMLHQGSRHALRTLQQNVVLEAVLGLGFMGCFWWLSWHLPELRWICRLAILSFLPFYIVYYRNFRHLQAAQQFAGSLCDQLHRSLRYWERTLRLYIRMNMLLLPAFFIIGALLGGYAAGALDALQNAILQRWYIWLPAAALATWAMYPLVRWLVHFTYGRHLEKIRSCLLELERNNE